MTDDPRRARRPARYREDAPLPQHFLDLATGEWVAAIVDWTPEGEMLRTEGARFRDALAAWKASRAMPRPSARGAMRSLGQDARPPRPRHEPLYAPDCCVRRLLQERR
jgi:hypothetical protein